ncbi:MAG: helix-turn-helix transcriptional regulator, partial [Gemmatimonadetes bacterium]|nr:helix-turn-helix transcriptional regulator [Gemmatimonadota bacterium]
MQDVLQQGRESFQRRAWAAAYASLSLADEAAPLSGDDLELLARAAYLIGRVEGYLQNLERAYHAHQSGNEPFRAARCAFWSGLILMLRGKTGAGTGWLARARRLIDGADCVEQGYLRLPMAEQRLAEGRPDEAHDTAADAAAIGERFGDADLVAIARHVQGRARLRGGSIESGL